MDFCALCGGREELQVFEIDHVEDDGHETVEGCICASCAQVNGFICEEHGLKYCAHFPEIDTVKDEWTVLYACIPCSFERVRNMDKKVKEGHLQFILQYNAELLARMRSWGNGCNFFEDKDDNMLHGLVVIAELHQCTLEQALIDLVTGAADKPLN